MNTTSNATGPAAYIRAAWPAVLVAMLSLLLQALDLVETFRYDRALLDVQPWRIITGNLVHLGWNHLWLNLAGLALIQALFGSRLTPIEWWVVVVLSSLVVGLGLHGWHPHLDWYVGLSGTLHGLFAAGLLLDLRRAPLSGTLLGLAFVAKLAWEQWDGPLPGSEGAAGGPVVVDAHLYGALAGALCVALLHLPRLYGRLAAAHRARRR